MSINKMKQSKLKLKLLAFAVALTGLAPINAYAQCDACVIGAVQAGSTAIVTAVSALTTAFGTAATADKLQQEKIQGAIVNAIQGATQANTTATTKAAEQINTGTSAYFAAEEIRKIKTRYESLRAAGGCATGASANGMMEATSSPGAGATGGGRGSGGGGGGGMAKPSAPGNPDIKRAIKIANGGEPPPPFEVQNSIAVKGACASYAAGDPVRGANCTNSIGSVGLDSGLPNADIRSDTLFDGPQSSASTKVRRLTIDPGTKEATAVDAYTRNLFTPVEPAQLSKRAVQTDAGRQYLAFKDSYDARISMAEKPIRDITVSRTLDPSLKEYIKTIQLDPIYGKFVQAYVAKNAPGAAGKGISLDEMINIEVTRRHMNPEWVKQMPANKDLIPWEQLQVSTFTNYLLWRLIQTNQINGAVMSQVAAASVRTEMTPQLNALHSAAQSR